MVEQIVFGPYLTHHANSLPPNIRAGGAVGRISPVEGFEKTPHVLLVKRAPTDGRESCKSWVQYPRESRDSRVARVAALSATWHGFSHGQPCF